MGHQRVWDRRTMAPNPDRPYLWGHRAATRMQTVRNGTAVTLVALLGIIILAAVVQLLRASG